MKPRRRSQVRMAYLGFLGLLGLGTGSSHHLGHLAEGQAKLDVALQLAGVKAVAFTIGGSIELEKPELDRAPLVNVAWRLSIW